MRQFVEKIKLEFRESEIKTFSFNKQIISINPYISLDNKARLITNYINSFIDNTDKVMAYLEAEYGLILGILETNTNIDIEDMNKTDLDNLISSDLWYHIKQNVQNYQELRGDISSVLTDVRDDNSYRENFSILVESIVSFLDKVSRIDISEEAIKNLIASLNDEAGKLNNYYPVVKTKKRGVSKKSADG